MPTIVNYCALEVHLKLFGWFRHITAWRRHDVIHVVASFIRVPFVIVMLMLAMKNVLPVMLMLMLVFQDWWTLLRED